MFKMINTFQNYSWGSKKWLYDIFPFSKDNDLPLSEVWMGAHPRSSSSIILAGKNVKLNDFILNDKFRILGSSIANKYGELPFLFKIICAEKALSVQVHPSKELAIAGFLREEFLGVDINSPSRNYKDKNHKPELIYALTPFLAMNGFRALHEIIHFVELIRFSHPIFSDFVKSPCYSSLQKMFSKLLKLDGEEKNNIIKDVKDVALNNHGLVWEVIKNLSKDYQDDIGILMPILLNVIELKPGEAMFLHSQTPHAYIRGVALEVMANSDNVLRAGLTSKHVDIDELLANVDFSSISYRELIIEPVVSSSTISYPIPVEDFSFSIHHIHDYEVEIPIVGPSIIFCCEGFVKCSNEDDVITLNKGESIFVGAYCQEIKLSGSGVVSHSYCYCKSP